MASIRLDIEADGFGELIYTNSSRPNKLSGDDRDAAFSLLCTAAAVAFRAFRPELDRLTAAARDLAMLMKHHEAGQSRDGAQDVKSLITPSDDGLPPPPDLVAQLRKERDDANAALIKTRKSRADLRTWLTELVKLAEQDGEAEVHMSVASIRRILESTI